jgi:UDP-2,3-diacylglucosamine hydrolase
VATLFISDLHLDAARPAATQSFIEFLRGEAREAQALYILGDLFEYWLGDDAPTPAGLAVAPELTALSASGVPCHFMHGNRDFLLGEGFAQQCGMSLLGEELVVDLYGRPTVLLHGDTLCTDDVVYQQVRAMVREPVWQADLLAKTPAERARFAMEARTASAEHQASAAMDIMDVNQGAVREAFERTGVRHMIHGHTHRPAVHEVPLGNVTGERIVLGDWYEQGSVLRVDADGARLEARPFA